MATTHLHYHKKKPCWRTKTYCHGKRSMLACLPATSDTQCGFEECSHVGGVGVSPFCPRIALLVAFGAKAGTGLDLCMTPTPCLTSPSRDTKRRCMRGCFPRQGPLRKSVGKALRKCLEGSPTPPRDTKKRSRMPEGGGEEGAGPQQNQHRYQHQHQLSSPREEAATGSSVAGRQRKKRRAREGGGDTAENNTKSDHEVYRDPPAGCLRTV